MKALKFIILTFMLFSSIGFLVPRIFAAPNSSVTDIYITMVFLVIAGYFILIRQIK